MTGFDDALEALMEARPESSRNALETILKELVPVVADEAKRAVATKKFQDLALLWKEVESSESVERVMKSLIDRVDRMHVIYVYSRFKNSPAVGPPLVKWAIAQYIENSKGEQAITAELTRLLNQEG